MVTNWESRYQSGDIPWEKGAPCPGLVDYLAENPPLDGKILVPGCGLGHDVRAISNALNEVAGLDIAPSAIKGAEQFPKSGAERYRLDDLFNLPEEFRRRFDWIWEHTCFCAIDPAMRTAYVRAVAEALKPGGHLLAIFYLDPGNDGADGPPFGVTIAEIDDFFGATFDLVREWKPVRAYPGREGRELMRLLRKRE